MFTESLFAETGTKIDPLTQIIFVSDYFIEDYVGGAELTSQALINESPYKVAKVHSKDVTIEMLEQHHKLFWIFGNFSELNSNLIPTIIANMRYSILEYDFKYCRFRSPEKHESVTHSPCQCHQELNGKVVSAFYHGAQSLWWMSEKQMDKYIDLFPFLARNDNFVLSSVFDKQTLLKFKLLRNQIANTGSWTKNDSWITCGSNSWIKGAEKAVEFCKERNLNHQVIWNVPYDKMLEIFAESKGYVYLPPGSDTCPRQVIEAKLLGCELELNENVLHANEEWFDTKDLSLIESYLYAAPGIFWNGIKRSIDHVPAVSGYLTTYNCEKQKYPYKQCIESLLSFCDEVCILDGGSNDGTWEFLQKISQSESKVKIKQTLRDWTDLRASVFDGEQKALAREMCTKEFCVQMDADEVMGDGDGQKIIDICVKFPKAADLLALPVIEFWGKEKKKVRLDIGPWKWRVSRNDHDITHGIPGPLRAFDDQGKMYSLRGSDGCDYISKSTLEIIPCMNFYSQDVDVIRRNAMIEHKESVEQYNEWFNAVIEQLPTVFHYSWVDFERKIRLYRDTWQKHWLSLWNLNIEDTKENNMFFDCPWSEVTDEMIKNLVVELEKTSGHVFHTKFNGEFLPHVSIRRDEPKIMQNVESKVP